MTVNRRDAMLGCTAALALGLPAMAHATLPLPPDDGKGVRMIPVRGGRYKVWTKTIGTGPVTVLALHGGPGASHDYLLPMQDYLPQAGFRLIFYDQLGCGRSDRPDDEALWTLPGYLGEVEEVRAALGLDRFVLYGHSWGGMLGIDYALAHPQHLRGLVISNMTAGIKAYLAYTHHLRDTLLSPADRARLIALEAAKDYANPDYGRIMMEKLYPEAICRLKPWPETVVAAFDNLNQQIYNEMQGPSEFAVTGNFRDWERWDRLHEIRTKALTIGARHDEMNPADMLKMGKLLPNGSSFICPDGAHLCMWDDQAFYFAHLLAWLKTV